MHFLHWSIAWHIRANLATRVGFESMLDNMREAGAMNTSGTAFSSFVDTTGWRRLLLHAPIVLAIGSVIGGYTQLCMPDAVMHKLVV